MKNIFFLCLAFIALTACNKEESSSDPCLDNDLIREVKNGEQSLQQFTYNGNCMVAEEVQLFMYSKFTYDQSDRILKEEHAMSLDPMSCYMPQGLPGETVKDPRKAKISSYSEYQYDASGRLKTKLLYYVNTDIQLLAVNSYEYTDNQITKLNIANPDGEVTQFHLFTYDASGNMTRDNYYLVSDGDPLLNRSSVYEFDEKINPFSIFLNRGEPGINTNTNNILKETVTDYSAGEYQYTMEYQLEYNSAGYPVKVNDKTFRYGN